MSSLTLPNALSLNSQPINSLVPVKILAFLTWKSSISLAKVSLDTFCSILPANCVILLPCVVTVPVNTSKSCFVAFDCNSFLVCVISVSLRSIRSLYSSKSVLDILLSNFPLIFVISCLTLPQSIWALDKSFLTLANRADVAVKSLLVLSITVLICSISAFFWSISP